MNITQMLHTQNKQQFFNSVIAIYRS